MTQSLEIWRCAWLGLPCGNAPFANSCTSCSIVQSFQTLTNTSKFTKGDAIRVKRRSIFLISVRQQKVFLAFS